MTGAKALCIMAECYSYVAGRKAGGDDASWASALLRCLDSCDLVDSAEEAVCSAGHD